MTHSLDETILPKAAAYPRAAACLNALTHGGASETLFIPGEDPAYFDTLMDEAFELHQPASTSDAALITDSVQARWILWRRQRAHVNVEHSLYSTKPDAILWTPADFHSIELLDRYKTQSERALHRTLTNVNAIRKDEFQRERWREHLAFQKERFALEREKFELAKAKDTRLAPKQQAEALRDAASANQDLALIDGKAKMERLRQEDNARFAPVQFSDQLNCHVIKQTITLNCNDDGSAFIDFLKPSHDEVHWMIQNLDQYAVPPACVVRTFNFLNFIPSEYRFLLDAGHKRPITGFFTFEHTFDFDTFIELAEKERFFPTHEPEEDDDE